MNLPRVNGTIKESETEETQENKPTERIMNDLASNDKETSRAGHITTSGSNTEGTHLMDEAKEELS